MIPPKISLRAARVNADLSQLQVANALGIDRVTVINYETGKSMPNWDTVEKLCALYKYPADFISFRKKLALSEHEESEG